MSNHGETTTLLAYSKSYGAVCLIERLRQVFVWL